MFHQIFYLIIVLLVISFVPSEQGSLWIKSPTTAFLTGMATYSAILTWITVQNTLFRRFFRGKQNFLLATTNLLLIAFLIFYHFFLNGSRIFPYSTALISLFSLSLYFFGIFIFHLSAYPHTPSGSRGLVSSGIHYAKQQIVLVIPFTIPFLLFSVFIDLTLLLPSANLKMLMLQQGESTIGVILFFGITALFLIAVLLFFPPIIQLLWRCKPLSDSELLTDLEALCKKAHFKHAGIKTWTVMNHAYTAGIIGILPQLRFIMFTKRLLHDLSPNAIKAILAHEIGHSYRKHLLIYPFIIFGMIVIAGVFSQFFSESIDEYFILKDLISPSPLWKGLYPLAVFIPYALITLAYFRIVFGYFSRIFERQADLHVFELDIPADDMQEALDRVGHLTGGTHLIPCWHHYGIQKRIDFLEDAKADPKIRNQHHWRVKKNLVAYFLFLIAGIVFLSSSFEQTSRSLSDSFNHSLHRTYTEKLIQSHNLSTTDPLIRSALESSAKEWAVKAPNGIVEFVAANTLQEEGNFNAAAQLMRAGWKSFNLTYTTPELMEEFSLLTEGILRQSTGQEKLQLEKVYNNAKHNFKSTTRPL